MTDGFALILNITVALALAALCGILAARLRQPPVAGYLIAGVLIGPFTPGFVGNVDTIAALAEVGVIFLMFALGVSFSVKELMRVGWVAVWATLLQVGLTVAGGMLLFRWWQGAVPGVWSDGMFMGCALAASSSMVMLKLLLDRGETAAAHGRLLLSMAIVQDFIIVLLIVFLPLLGAAQASHGWQVILTELLGVLLKATAFIAVGLYVGARLIPRFMAYLARQRSAELFIVAAAVIALGSAVLSASLGLSAALGAFMAGLMLSESEFDHRVLTEVVPLRDLFATLFFVSVGMLIDVPFLLEHWATVLAFAALAIMLKAVATVLGVLPFRLTPRTAAFTMLCMVPIGELNFVLAQSGMAAGHISADSYKLILAAALLSIITLPTVLRAAPWLGQRIAQLPVLWRCFDPNIQLIGHSGGLEAHAVIIGYGRVGHHLALGLRARGMPAVVIDSRLPRVREAMSDGWDAIYGSATAHNILEAADIAHARIVVIALTDCEATLAVMHQIRLMNDRVVITARAEQADDEARLRAAGASLVIVPELAGADALLNETLDLLGMPR